MSDLLIRADLMWEQQAQRGRPVRARVPRAPMALAVFHALCGDADQAADWFEKAIEQRDPAVVGYLRTPLMRILRSSPRWPALAKQMNLPEVG